MAALDLTAATLAAEKAREALAEKDNALASVDVEIAATRADLGKLDALSSLNSTQLLASENLRRSVRVLTQERRPAAIAAATAARSALETAEREVARIEHRQAEAAERAAEAEVRTEVERAARSILARLAEWRRRSAVAAGLADAAGVERRSRGTPCEQVERYTRGQASLQIPGPGAAPPQDLRCSTLAGALGVAFKDVFDAIVNEDRARHEPPRRAAAAPRDTRDEVAFANLIRARDEEQRPAPLPMFTPPPEDDYTPGRVLCEE